MNRDTTEPDPITSQNLLEDGGDPFIQVSIERNSSNKNRENINSFDNLLKGPDMNIDESPKAQNGMSSKIDDVSREDLSSQNSND